MSVFRGGLLIVTLLLPCVSVAQDDSSEKDTRLARTWMVSLTGGFTDTFQMVLGGTFGKGPDFQDKLSAGVNNVFRDGDNLCVFGWSTTDFPSATPNWQTGMMYKTRVIHRKGQTLIVGGGVQRWLLPLVKTGANDWVLAGYLNYSTKVARVPIVVTEDSYSAVASTLPTGSALYTQAYTQHALLKRERIRLFLRQGPGYTHAWGLYGAEGNRVVRYGGSLVAEWHGATFEAGYRQQWGLEERIPDNRYWSFLVTRQFTGPLHAR